MSKKFSLIDFSNFYKTLVEDRDVLSEDVLMEDRIDFIKNKYPVINSSHDSFAQHRQSDKIVDFLAEKADPTKKKVYTQWLVKNYHQGGFRQEDAPRLQDSLGNFEKYKQKLPAEQRDINKFTSISQVESVIKPHIGTGATNAEQIALLKDKSDIPGHELKYEDDHIKVFHVSSEEASKKMYGSSTSKKPGAFPTEWCTAWMEPRECQHGRYSKDGPLYSVHRKSDGAVFQYHVNSDQFMDATDDTIKKEDFESIREPLHKAWEKHPELLS